MLSQREGYVLVASLEISTVRPTNAGFELYGVGPDAAEYVMNMNLDMHIDNQTRAVLGEIFSQSEWEIFRRPRQPLKSRVRKARATTRAGQK